MPPAINTCRPALGSMAKRLLGVAIMLVIDLLLFGAIGLTIWAIQMMWIPVWEIGRASCRERV